MRRYFIFLQTICFLLFSCSYRESNNISNANKRDKSNLKVVNSTPTNQIKKEIYYKNHKFIENTPSETHLFEDVPLQYGYFDIYFENEITLVESDVNLIGKNDFLFFKTAIAKKDMNALVNFDENGAEIASYTTINQKTYIDSLTITQYTANSMSIQRILYLFTDGYYFQIRFVSYFPNDPNNMKQMNRYGKDGAYINNIKELAINIKNNACEINDLNKWYIETTTVLNGIIY